jgi:hypothetical protein
MEVRIADEMSGVKETMSGRGMKTQDTRKE